MKSDAADAATIMSVFLVSGTGFKLRSDLPKQDRIDALSKLAILLGHLTCVQVGVTLDEDDVFLTLAYGADIKTIALLLRIKDLSVEFPSEITEVPEHPTKQ